VVDQVLHQRPTQPMSFHVGADEDGVFRTQPVRIGGIASDAEQLTRLCIEGDESHIAGIVDLGQAGEQPMRKALLGRKEPQAVILGRNVGHEFRVERLVFWPDGTQKNVPDTSNTLSLLPFRRIGLDRQRHARRIRFPQDHNARIERDNARRVGEQRIDIDLGDTSVVGDQLANAHEAIGNRVQVRRWSIPVAFEWMRV
jgi:hypothetical protein